MGGTLRRSDSPRRDKDRTAVGAACAIFDDGGRILLVHHSYGRLNWELPGGGAEPGEPPDQAAGRELLEETGIKASIGRLTGVYFELDQAHGAMLHFVFRCRWDQSVVPRAASPEIAEVGYWPLDDLPTPISDFTEVRIRDAWAGRPAAVMTIDARRWRTRSDGPGLPDDHMA